MKIYFAGSIRGGRDDLKIYAAVIEILQSYGEVSTEHIAAESFLEVKKEVPSDRDIYFSNVEMLKNADLMVAEVSNPSLGVGYEIGLAESFSKRVICLFREDGKPQLSAMIGGNEKLEIIKYTQVEELREKLEAAI